MTRSMQNAKIFSFLCDMLKKVLALILGEPWGSYADNAGLWF